MNLDHRHVPFSCPLCEHCIQRVIVLAIHRSPGNPNLVAQDLFIWVGTVFFFSWNSGLVQYNGLDTGFCWGVLCFSKNWIEAWMALAGSLASYYLLIVRRESLKIFVTLIQWCIDGLSILFLELMGIFDSNWINEQGFFNFLKMNLMQCFHNI